MKSNGAKIGHNNIISSCLGPFKSALNNALESAVNKTLQHIFELAENASSNQQETSLFEQYNRLKKSLPRLSNALLVTTQNMPDDITEQISLGQENIVLSLIEDEELEISLAFTQLESVLDIKFTKYLFALEKRLKILFASKNISKTNMPFGVTSVCWILSQTLDTSQSDVATKSIIVEKLKNQLIEKLLEVYKIIDKNFVRAGILPNIKIETVRRRSSQNQSAKQVSEQQAENQANNQASNQEEGFSQSPEGIQQQAYKDYQQSLFPNSNVLKNQENPKNQKMREKSSELVNSIFDLMSNGRTQNQQPANASNIDNQAMDNTLDNLSKVTSVVAGSTEIDKLKEMILEDVKNETGIYYPSLNMKQQNTMDVLGMFYEEVRSDESIDSNMISSLNAINIPLIRTAIKDDTFFENPDHPAREYLEKIIYASQKWHGTSVVKNLHKFSSNIASEYDGTPESFDMANEDLESYLRLTDRRAKKAEEKWVNAAKGKEKLELSRHKVEEVVENVSKQAKPEFVQNVIKYVLQDALTLSLLRHGEDSKEWHKNINTSEAIAKMANPDLIKELTPKQKIESLHHLDETMDELGFSENDRTKTLNNIKTCAEAASEQKLDKDIELEEVATINQNKKNIKKAGSKRIEDLRPLTAKEKSELTKIRLMPYGTIFDFITNQQRDKIRRKLSWFSPVSNKALFVSLLGKRPFEKSLNAIAIDIARKNIIVVKVEDKKYFDKVLGGIFSKLKSAVGG